MDGRKVRWGCTVRLGDTWSEESKLEKVSVGGGEVSDTSKWGGGCKGGVKYVGQESDRGERKSEGSDEG